MPWSLQNPAPAHLTATNLSDPLVLGQCELLQNGYQVEVQGGLRAFSRLSAHR